MINLPELKVFVTAAEELNFSRAAERLHLSQSAVSQNIQAIEREYNVELFVRHGRSVRLSEAGQLLLPKARDVLNSTRLLEDVLLNAKGDVVGELAISCSTTSSQYLIPNLLVSFNNQYPHVRIRVSEMRRSAVVEEVLAQATNFGVVGKLVEHRDIEHQLLFEDQVVLIVPIDHPWAKGGKVTPKDLIGQPFIRREYRSGTCELLYAALSQHGIQPDMLSTVMELGNAEAVEMAVEKKAGIAFISQLVASRALALGRVKKVVVEGLNVSQKIYLCRHAANTFTVAETKFWEFVTERREQLTNELLYNLADITPA